VKGPLADGRFEELREIGQGGLARVYAARDNRLGCEVAIKALHPHLAEHHIVRERFRREVALSRKLDHPGVVRVFDLFEEDGRLFFSMERVEGVDLKEHLRLHAPLPAAERLDLLRQIAAALGAAHAQGIIHRDVKPQNVMRQPDGRIKVLDFGLARVESMAGLTSHSVMLGTPDYMAPEAVSGLPVDGRSDLYSLGVIAYEMACGRLPFTARTPLELLQKMATTDGPAPEGPDVQPADAAAVARLLRCAVEERFDGVADLLAALDAGAPAVEAPAVRAVCLYCGAAQPARPGFCLACGAEAGVAEAGDALLALARAAGPPADLARVMATFGAEPNPTEDLDARVASPPAVLLVGVEEAFARGVQAALLERRFTAEVRQLGENNFDLLHASGTPSAIFALGLLGGWAAVVGGAWFLTGPLGACAALVAGPPVGWLFQHRTHHFLAPLFTLQTGRATPEVRRLAKAYRAFLGSQPSPALRRIAGGLMTRARELLRDLDALALPPEADEGLRRLALRTAEDGAAALAGLKPLEDVLHTTDARRLGEELERAATRARISRDPDERAREAAAAARREDDLRRLVDAEEERARRVQRVLGLSSRLEATRRELALAGAQPAALSRAEGRLEAERAALRDARDEVDALGEVSP